jgi:tRNA C32,U32 (ribose-2'-O)-methylase TrmJ
MIPVSPKYSVMRLDHFWELLLYELFLLTEDTSQLEEEKPTMWRGYSKSKSGFFHAHCLPGPHFQTCEVISV